MDPHHPKTIDEPVDVIQQRRLRKLTRGPRNRVRRIARQALLDHPSDPEKATTVAQAEVDHQFGSVIGAIALAVAIKLAADFIAHWIQQNVFEPPMVYQDGEPGMEADDEADAMA